VRDDDAFVIDCTDLCPSGKRHPYVFEIRLVGYPHTKVSAPDGLRVTDQQVTQFPYGFLQHDAIHASKLGHIWYFVNAYCNATFILHCRINTRMLKRLGKPMTKRSKDMSTTEFKNIAEAAADFTRKTTQNMTELSIKTWKDAVSFSDAIAKAQADVVKGYVPNHGYQEMTELFSKMQSDAIKTVSGWTNMFNHGK